MFSRKSWELGVPLCRCAALEESWILSKPKSKRFRACFSLLFPALAGALKAQTELVIVCLQTIASCTWGGAGARTGWAQGRKGGSPAVGLPSVRRGQARPACGGGPPIAQGRGQFPARSAAFIKQTGDGRHSPPLLGAVRFALAPCAQINATLERLGIASPNWVWQGRRNALAMV